MLAALFSFSAYAIGHFIGDLRQASQLSDSVIVRGVLTTLYYLLPNLSNFGFITEASHGRMVPMRMAMQSTLYAVVYIGILLAASALIFQRRNFK
jgi:hypothetical protein